MVKVATQPADNPLDVLSRKLHLGPGMGRDVPRLSLPGKLVFPSSTGSHFSMLGIGDIVMPGLLLCFVLRYDNYKKQANGEVPGPVNMSGRMQRVSYFHCTLIGYFVGAYRKPDHPNTHSHKEVGLDCEELQQNLIFICIFNSVLSVSLSIIHSVGLSFHLSACLSFSVIPSIAVFPKLFF